MSLTKVLILPELTKVFNLIEWEITQQKLRKKTDERTGGIHFNLFHWGFAVTKEF